MSETSMHIELEQRPETKEEPSYIRPLQSANVLFKFMDRIKFLKDILLKKAILPRFWCVFVPEPQKVNFVITLNS